MSKLWEITADMIDWDAYKTNVEYAISNEKLWGFGGSLYAEDNIAELEKELELIENEDYETLLSMYDKDVWVDYLKADII